MIASRKGVEVWIADQPTGRSLMRQLIVDERPSPNEGLVALQTAELLRTTLLSRSDVPPKAPPPPSVPSEKPPGVAPPPPSSRRRPPSGNIQAGGGRAVQPRRRSGAAVWLTVGLAGAARSASRWTSARRWARPASPDRKAPPMCAPGSPVSPVFVRRERPDRPLCERGGGAALVHLTADATANPLLVAKPTARPRPPIYARVDGGLEATGWLRVGYAASPGSCRWAYRFASRETRRPIWGRPFLSGLLVVDFSW